MLRNCPGYDVKLHPGVPLGKISALLASRTRVTMKHIIVTSSPKFNVNLKRGSTGLSVVYNSCGHISIVKCSIV